MATHRIAMNSANVVMNAQLGAGETLQHDAESTGRDVKAARLEPYTFRIRNPEAVVLHVDAGNEVLAAPSIRIEAVGETVEGSDGQCVPFVGSMTERPVSI